MVENTVLKSVTKSLIESNFLYETILTILSNAKDDEQFRWPRRKERTKQIDSYNKEERKPQAKVQRHKNGVHFWDGSEKQAKAWL